MVTLLWLIPALPLAAFVLISAFLRRPTRLAALVSILAILGSFVISLLTLLEGLAATTFVDAAHADEAHAGEAHVWSIQQAWHWLSIGGAHLELATFVDPIGAVMLVVVTFVSLLVQIYSMGYMVEHGELDPGFSRFFSYLSLFTTSMLGLVLANNFVQLFIFWELVGLCSFLLIGFWYFKPEAADAAKKAFITTRFGDLGFLIGILVVFAFTNTFDFHEVEEAVAAGALVGLPLTLAMVLLFCGAIGKSAQFPLHVWLPDAMEGPTPVSALIHAATMVAAGVFMVGRLFTLFSASADAMTVVAWIGAITAIFAATHGLVMRDIKRVLAYSTVSQLGYMMMALGLGGLAAGIFHLTTHAFFKALLFLGSGSVIHGAGEQDMFKLGGLRRSMPITRWTFLIGSLALAGVFPFAGFWSKDEILITALDGGHIAFLVIGIVTAFLTAFYIFRAYYLTFGGEPRPDWVDPDVEHGLDATRFEIDVAQADQIARYTYEPHAYYHATHGPATADHEVHGGHAVPQGAPSAAEAGQDRGHELTVAHHGTEDVTVGHHEGHARGAHHAHESPWTMTVPLIVLSFFALTAGLVGMPFIGNPFGQFVTGEFHEPHFNAVLAGGTLALALIAWFIARAIYARPNFARDPLVEQLGALYPLFARRYYVDELYNWSIHIFVLQVSRGLAWFDRTVIDGVVNLVGWVTRQVGNMASFAETGRAPNYALAAFGGIAVIVLILLTSPVGR